MSSDPVIDGIVNAMTGATRAQIVAAIKIVLAAVTDRRDVASKLANDTPWTLDGAATNRWVHFRGQQYAAGPGGPGGVCMGEATANADGTTATVFVYRPNPASDPALFVGSPLDGMTADSPAAIIALPTTKAAAYQAIAAALTAAPAVAPTPVAVSVPPPSAPPGRP